MCVLLQGGPSPRSCHRVCLDEHTQTLYFLGRFTEVSAVDRSSSLVSEIDAPTCIIIHCLLAVVVRVTFTAITLMVLSGRSFHQTQQLKEDHHSSLIIRYTLSLSLSLILFKSINELLDVLQCCYPKFVCVWRTCHLFVSKCLELYCYV